MPLKVTDDAPKTFPNPDYLTLQNFKRGVITLINESRLPKNALKEASNLFLAEDGQPTIRPGIDWFGTTPTTTTTSAATVAGTASGTNWTTPTNTTSDNATYAVYATTTQDNLKLTNFGFSVPTGATVTGVTIVVNGNGTDATAGNRSIEVGLTKDGTTLSGTRAASQNMNQTTDTNLTFGSSASLFGTTLTPAEVSASTFGILLRAANTNAGARNIDYVTVVITYTNQEAIEGFDYFDSNGTIHLLVVAGGYIHRSLDDGATWTQCNISGQLTPPLTKGNWTNTNQYNSFLYHTNGVNNIIRYDGTTTLQAYTALSTPSAPTVAKTGLASTTYTYNFKVAQVNTVGFTAASTATSIQVTNTRDVWDATANYVTVSGTVSTTATRVDVYISEDAVNYYYLGSAVVDAGTGAYSFKDDGSARVIASTVAPAADTTQGPKVEELSNIGSRMYGVRDSVNKYRSWFTSGQPPYGVFSNAYDGGYIDWQIGGKLYPVKAVDYRSGKGDPIATIFMDSADGQGGIIQVSLDTVTVGDISITLPSAYQLPGSRGTPAPRSVVNVLNDYYFYNSQAVYNLGTRAQFLNILSTDESSSNIRPNFRQISREAEGEIAGAYHESIIYLSYPVGSTTNNKTAIYNTELKAWLPEAFDVGFTKFLRYTDQNKAQHLLVLKPGDTRLSEISTGIQGDYGQAFATSLTTGLYKTTNDVFEFQFTEEAEFELAATGGNINVQLLGIDRTRGYHPIKTVTLTTTTQTSNVGWDTFGWDTTRWDETSTAPTLVSEPSIKRYFSIQKELNAVQWHVFTTNSIEARYILRTLQSWGTPTQSGHPSTWRLTPI